MTPKCQYPLCRSSVPQVLEEEKLCALHLIRQIDAHCREIRREALRGPLPLDRRAEINAYLYSQAIILAQIATSGERLPDETRPCLLSVFLNLINVCEKVARRSGEEHEKPSLAPLPPLAVAWPAAAVK
ncbi:MAG TPA: hypothetical protein VNJ12_11345 [Candidatus Dormibacteraeota bacterium]|nr:hypothetical protein [Candidatus Dormibacteraeota bacterium]